jgi:glycosyltransferase involved in cell wall biosynthesis
MVSVEEARAPEQITSLRGRPILSFAKDRWDGVWFNRQHLLSRLASVNRVLYAASPCYVRDTLRGLWGGERAPSGLSRVTDSLHLYTPPRWLPYNYRSRAFDRLTERMRIRQVQGALRELRMEKPILYLWEPSFANMIGRFDESLVVYHCYDEHVDFPGVTAADRRRILELVEYILSRADVVFAVSSSIYERKRPFNPNTHVVRNAADFTLFAQAQEPRTRVPDDLLAIPRPVVGCVTRVVASYFNVGLLRRVFERRPDWSLVVVGPEGTHTPEERRELDALKSLPNVHLLGRRAQAALPGYLKGFDVCLMAYPDIQNVLHSESPLKMYEYLAAGKPVVSTPLPLISHLGDVIGFARDEEEWVGAIERAMRENTPAKVEQRQALARENTWDQRAAFIADKLAEELARGARSG